MMKPSAFAVVMIVCVAPALAQADRPDLGCGPDPEVTGSLSSADPRSLHISSEKSDRIEMTPPEESWQEQAQADAAWRRRRLIDCGVD